VKAASKKMGATAEGTEDVDGCDDGEEHREVSQRKMLSLELRLPLSIPPNEFGPLAYVLSPGYLRCPRTCMRSSLYDASPNWQETTGDERVPPKRGTKCLRNA